MRKRKVDAKVIDALADQRWHYVFDIAHDTGLRPGRVYPALGRLFDAEIVERAIEKDDPNRPRRVMYRLVRYGS